MAKTLKQQGFNPLDRVKFVQIDTEEYPVDEEDDAFQSPRSGQICSNSNMTVVIGTDPYMFQSPRSGQICSNIFDSE